MNLLNYFVKLDSKWLGIIRVCKLFYSPKVHIQQQIILAPDILFRKLLRSEIFLECFIVQS